MVRVVMLCDQYIDIKTEKNFIDSLVYPNIRQETLQNHPDKFYDGEKILKPVV